jgi:hypothetical protein
MAFTIPKNFTREKLTYQMLNNLTSAIKLYFDTVVQLIADCVATNTANKVVKRGASGEFSAGAITATSFIGPVTGDVTGNLTGDVTGNTTGTHTGPVSTASLTATGNLDIGDYDLRAKSFTSDVPTGTPPLVVTSTTEVANLNAATVTGFNKNLFQYGFQGLILTPEIGRQSAMIVTGTGNGTSYSNLEYDAYSTGSSGSSNFVASRPVRRVYDSNGKETIPTFARIMRMRTTIKLDYATSITSMHIGLCKTTSKGADFYFDGSIMKGICYNGSNTQTITFSPVFTLNNSEHTYEIVWNGIHFEFFIDGVSLGVSSQYEPLTSDSLSEMFNYDLSTTSVSRTMRIYSQTFLVGPNA